MASLSLCPQFETNLMVYQRWSDIYVVFTKLLCCRDFCVWYVTKLKFTDLLQMASLSLCPQFETNLMVDQRRSDIYVVFTKLLCGRDLCLVSYKAKIHRFAPNGFTESLSSI